MHEFTVVETRPNGERVGHYGNKVMLCEGRSRKDFAALLGSLASSAAKKLGIKVVRIGIKGGQYNIHEIELSGETTAIFDIRDPEAPTMETVFWRLCSTLIAKHQPELR